MRIILLSICLCAFFTGFAQTTEKQKDSILFLGIWYDEEDTSFVWHISSESVIEYFHGIILDTYIYRLQYFSCDSEHLHLVPNQFFYRWGKRGTFCYQIKELKTNTLFLRRVSTGNTLRMRRRK